MENSGPEAKDPAGTGDSGRESADTAKNGEANAKVSPLADAPAGDGAPPTAAASDEVVERIMKVIDVMRPAVQADNGDLLFRSFDADTGKVEVELIGACVTCPASTQTLKAGVERIMRDRVPEVTEVENIGQVLQLEDLDGDIGETAVSL